jgi:hypothetical protein
MDEMLWALFRKVNGKNGHIMLPNPEYEIPLQELRSYL